MSYISSSVFNFIVHFKWKLLRRPADRTRPRAEYFKWQLGCLTKSSIGALRQESRIAFTTSVNADLNFFLSGLCFIVLGFCNKPGECTFKGDVLPFIHDLYHHFHKGPSLFREFFLCLHGSGSFNKAC